MPSDQCANAGILRLIIVLLLFGSANAVRPVDDSEESSLSVPDIEETGLELEHKAALPGTNQVVDKFTNEAVKDTAEALQDLQDVFNVARGKTITNRSDDSTLRTLQGIKTNEHDDHHQLLQWTGINLFLLGGTVGLMLLLARCCPEVYSDGPCHWTISRWFNPFENQELDHEVLTVSGLDGLMLIKFLRFGLWLSITTAIFNIGVICPFRWYASPQAHFSTDCSNATATALITDDARCGEAARLLRGSFEVEFADGNCNAFPRQSSNKYHPGHLRVDASTPQQVCLKDSLDLLARLSMRHGSSLKGSNVRLLWLDIFDVYVVTMLTLYGLRRLMVEFIELRTQYMCRTSARSTVFVEGIPPSDEESPLESFFKGLFPDGVKEAYQVTNPPAQPSSVPEPDPYFLPFGFVTFHSVKDAHKCAQVSLSNSLGGSWLAQLAPEPPEILWSNLYRASTSTVAIARQVLAQFLFFLLFILWVFPVFFLRGMLNLDFLQSLPILGPSIEELKQDNASLYELIDDNLSVVSLTLFMSFLPQLLYAINGTASFPAMRFVEIASERQYFKFLFFYVTLANQPLLKFLKDLLAHPPQAFMKVAKGLPEVSHWYMSYLIFTLPGLACVVIRPTQLLVYVLYKKACGGTLSERFLTDPDESIGTTAARWNFYLSIAIMYSVIMPVILPISTMVFLAALIVYRYQLVSVVRLTYDTGGLFLPAAIENAHLVLYIYQVMMLGVIQGGTDTDTFWQSLALVVLTGVNYLFFRPFSDSRAWLFLPMDTPEIIPQDAKDIGLYRPPPSDKDVSETAGDT
jgi:hypothetical protein